MLNSQKIQPLLLQLLEPCPQLTHQLPLSASLVSLSLQKPLLSCVSKAAVEQDKAENHAVASLDNIGEMALGSEGEFNYHSTPQSQSQSQPQSAASRADTEHTPLLNHMGNSDGKGNTEMISAKIDTLQRQIDLIDENYDVDYINANVNPIDNLDIITLMVIKEWNQNQNQNQQSELAENKSGVGAWKVYEFGKYRLYMGLVNKDYTILLCTPREYPAAIAVSKTVSVCQILSEKI
jgi:hypothetical protein